MGVIVKKVELSWLDRTYVWPVMKGMGITFQHFIKTALKQWAVLERDFVLDPNDTASFA